MTNLENLEQYRKQLMGEMLKNSKRISEYAASLSNLPEALIASTSARLQERAEEGLRISEKLLEVTNRIDVLEAEAIDVRNRRNATASTYSK